MTAEDPDKPVSRRRYDREKRARQEAEHLLEGKSRELFEANETLRHQAENLERMVQERTAELQKALTAAEKAGEMRRRFLAVMSHEIRTPLGGMLGMLDLLGDHVASDDGRSLLDHAAASGETLKRIVNDVLDFSKLDAGKMHFEREPVDIRALVNGVKVMVETQDPARAAEMRIEIAEDVPARFLGDATRIRQVIANLVDNAVKFTRSGPIDVRIRTCGGGARLRVDIADQGPGLSPDEQDRLFADFSQIERNLSKTVQGTGLGLAICKRIIEGQGGQIGVDSAKGAGATFWFELPLVSGAGDTAPRSSQARVADGPHPLAGLHVLVAEDNPINRRLITGYLGRFGITADIAENGREAVEMFDPARHQLVLMDIAMPEMDGLTAARALRQRWGADRLPPILALTAHVMEAILEDAQSVGIDLILSKPLSLSELEAALMAHAPRGGAKGPGVQTAGQAEDLPAGLQSMMQPTAQRDLCETMGVAGTLHLLRDFLRNSELTVERIRTASALHNVPEVRAAAHEMKGAAGLVGLSVLMELAEILEDQADFLSAEDVAEVLDSIGAELDALKDELVETPP